MTKLAPIEELAKQVGLMDNEGNLLVHCEPSEKENRELDADILKSFRQAIISDFVSKLNVAMTTSAYTDDDGVFHPSAKLYALPEWKTK